MKYIFIQTNRVKIKQLLNSFSKKSSNLELFIAPRPLPKEIFKFYTAFARVNNDSKNYLELIKLNNHRIISESEFNSKIKEIKYFWKREANE